MSRNERFHWTRKRYQHAQHLNRLLPNFFSHLVKPEIVRRYHELWDQYPDMGDPLRVPLKYRHHRDDVPF